MIPLQQRLGSGKSVVYFVAAPTAKVLGYSSLVASITPQRQT